MKDHPTRTDKLPTDMHQSETHIREKPNPKIL